MAPETPLFLPRLPVVAVFCASVSGASALLLRFARLRGGASTGEAGSRGRSTAGALRFRLVFAAGACCAAEPGSGVKVVLLEAVLSLADERVTLDDMRTASREHTKISGG